LQDKVRLGLWDAETLAVINSLVDAPLMIESISSAGTSSAGGQAAAADMSLIDLDYCPTVVSTNVMRKKIFEEHMKILSEQFIRTQRDLPILILATIEEVISRGGHRSRLTEAQFDYIKTLTDNKFDRMQYEFYIFLGAYILFSHNLGVQYGIANGTRGRIIGWQFPPGTTYDEITYHEIKVRIPSGNVMPDFVLVELANPNAQKRAPNQPPNLPNNVIAVPIISHSVDEPLKVPTSPTTTIDVKVRITTLPIRQAQVLTCHSIQGNQYKRYFIAEPKPHNFYIMFSRGSEGLDSLSLRQCITADFAKKSKPKKDLLQHVADLQTYNQQSIDKIIMEYAAR
jgi:hypothetical protein